jgi:hypothetical protein
MNTITAAPSTTPKLKKLSVGGIAKKAVSTTKTAYPVLVNAAASILAARIIQKNDEITVLEAAMETDKLDLKKLAMPFWFKSGQGKHEVESSISVDSTAGEVLVVFPNRYKVMKDDVAVRSVLGDVTDTYFGQRVEFKIDGDKLPADTDKAQALIDDLTALFAKYGAEEALTCAETFKQTASFHVRRHLDFTVEENMAIDAVAPIIPQVKTKGRGSK